MAVTLKFTMDNGNQKEFSIEDIMRAFGVGTDEETAKTVELVCQQGENSISAMATCDKNSRYSYNISIHQNVEKTTGLVSITELPNEKMNQLVTYIYPGNDETEVDEWLACIGGGWRRDGDISNRLMYADYDMVSVVSRTNIENGALLAFTEDDMPVYYEGSERVPAGYENIKPERIQPLCVSTPSTPENKPEEEKSSVESDEDHPDQCHIIPAKTLPKGWTWHGYNDGSGSLQSPSGDSFFRYDCMPYAAIGGIEYKEKSNKGWEVFTGSLVEFRKYAEGIVSKM